MKHYNQTTHNKTEGKHIRPLWDNDKQPSQTSCPQYHLTSPSSYTMIPMWSSSCQLSNRLTHIHSSGMNPRHWCFPHSTKPHHILSDRWSVKVTLRLAPPSGCSFRAFSSKCQCCYAQPHRDAILSVSSGLHGQQSLLASSTKTPEIWWAISHFQPQAPKTWEIQGQLWQLWHFLLQ